MTEANHPILKRDRRGRLHYSKEQKSALVDAYQCSGLSGPRFAALHGVNYQTLASWLKKRKSTSSPSRPVPSNPAMFFLAEAEIQELPSAGAMELTLPGGGKLAIRSIAHIPFAVALLRELTQPRPC